MNPINPTVVQTPDGAIGVLIARHGLQGCVEFGNDRIVRAYPLVVLNYHMTANAPQQPTRR